MPTWEGVRLKVQKIFRVKFAKRRKKKLINTDFTIISNNCWGGMIYESYNLPKQSPTVGLFIMANDYIKFLKKLHSYILSDITFISPQASRYKAIMSDDLRFGTYPIGAISNGDESIEIFFLHYHSEEEARDKWLRRCKRINWDKLLIKFNDQNGCTENDIKEFDKLPFKNKICFSVNKYPQYRSVVTIKAPRSHKYIRASYEPFGKNKYLDITKLINSL